MSDTSTFFDKANRRIFLLALFIIIIDQFTKWIVKHTIYEGDEHVVIPGFFNLAFRLNTGAAWSFFTGNNAVLAVVALVALVVLYLSRRHFNSHTVLGQIAFGLIFGGIIGNLIDRLHGRHAVVDFLHFYMQPRGALDPWDFPAFNVADSAICTGVALIFIISWRKEEAPKPAASV